MYQVEPANFGLKITISGITTPEEIELIQKECIKQLYYIDFPWNTLWNICDLKLLSNHTEDAISQLILSLQKLGLQKSFFLYNTNLAFLQFRKIELSSNLSHEIRYMDIKQTANWERIVNKWFVAGIDPCKKHVEIINYI